MPAPHDGARDLHALALNRYTIREQTTLGTGLVRADTNTIVKFFFVFAHFLQRSSEREGYEKAMQRPPQRRASESSPSRTQRERYT